VLDTVHTVVFLLWMSRLVDFLLVHFSQELFQALYERPLESLLQGDQNGLRRSVNQVLFVFWL